MAEEWYKKDPYPDEPSFSLHGRTPSEASSRRRSHFASQRVSAPSNSSSSGSQPVQPRPTSKGKQVRYDEPAGFENLEEAEVPPPVEERTDQQRSGLEDNVVRPDSSGGKQPSPSSSWPLKSSIKQPFFKRRKPAQEEEEEQELTEVAAPPPIRRSQDEERAAGGAARQQNLEDLDTSEETSDESSPAYGGQRQPADYLSKSKKGKGAEVPRYLTELYTIAYLILFAILGTLARLGTQWLVFYPGTPVVTPVIWANFGGSLIMGFLAEDQGLFRDGSKPNSNAKNSEGLDAEAKGGHLKRKKTIPLYIGLATGFCGSFTSFSSFARDCFLALSNDLPTPVNHPHPGIIVIPSSTVDRNAGYSFEAFLHVVISTLAFSIGALIMGAQIAAFLEPYTPRIHGSFVRKFVDPLAVLLGFGCWLGAVLLAIFPPDRGAGTEMWRGEVLFALVFAPLGCLLRFYVSMKLNGLVPAFPLGTFAVNMFGTAVEGMCFDLQHAGIGADSNVGGGLLGCQVLQGVMDGFCGTLTTVSTWVAEINGLKRKHGWFYAFGSVIGGLCLLVVIMGSVRWSIGYQLSVCNTGYASKVNG